MRENPTVQEEPVKVLLLGASFDTGNAGVSSLAESSIKCILNRWDDARITLLGGEDRKQRQINVGVRWVAIDQIPIRFSKNIFLANHFVRIIGFGLGARMLPFERVKIFLTQRSEYYHVIAGADMAVDITGGDSFSDIYGLRRFILGFLYKLLVLVYGRELVMLPQTYGPFERAITRSAARYILKNASVVYSRDRAGVEYLRGLMKNYNCDGKLRFMPDVGFVTDSVAPEHIDEPLRRLIERKDNIIVGFNISGLLFNGGYTRDNMFDLKIDYRSLVYEIIELLKSYEKTSVLLVPHVIPPAGYEVENDQAVCSRIFDELSSGGDGRILTANGGYNYKEIKYVIGLCDFFIGSRMHACIAAMSQCVPTVGVAYSRKFEGVFESVGMADCVADARRCDQKEIIEIIESVFCRREQIRKSLEAVMPGVKKNILNIFMD